MDGRKRFGMGLLWTVVALLALVTIREPALTLGTIASLAAASFAFFLATVYLFNPRGVLDRRPF